MLGPCGPYRGVLRKSLGTAKSPVAIQGIMCWEDDVNSILLAYYSLNQGTVAPTGGRLAHYMKGG